VKYDKPTYRTVGDGALLVELGDSIDRTVNRSVRTLLYAMSEQQLDGVHDLLPGYASLLVVFDPLRVSVSALRILVEKIHAEPDAVRIPEPRTVRIPVAYGGEFGPDLDWVAQFHGISPEEVVRLHCGTSYTVYMIGFTPGFPYMGELPGEIATPRRKTPRTRVVRGSVGIARHQTGIYPVDSPGGWQVIGRTPVALFDPGAHPPTPLEMGDTVVFYPIEKEAFENWQP
jgi:KipI family sensor histidine kinase inhibitor